MRQRTGPLPLESSSINSWVTAEYLSTWSFVTWIRRHMAKQAYLSVVSLFFTFKEREIDILYVLTRQRGSVAMWLRGFPSPQPFSHVATVSRRRLEWEGILQLSLHLIVSDSLRARWKQRTWNTAAFFLHDYRFSMQPNQPLTVCRG